MKSMFWGTAFFYYTFIIIIIRERSIRLLSLIDSVAFQTSRQNGPAKYRVCNVVIHVFSVTDITLGLGVGIMKAITGAGEESAESDEERRK
jgi:hypothetical protein